VGGTATTRIDANRTIDKISDSDLRIRLTEWIYFRRATAALKDKQFEEAEKLASQIEGQEQRAYLHIEIAKGLLKRNESHAREVLDEAIIEAKKAGVTIFSARTGTRPSTRIGTTRHNQEERGMAGMDGGRVCAGPPAITSGSFVRNAAGAAALSS
jgi:hypothetical protein